MNNFKNILDIILSRYVVFILGRYSRGKSLALTFLTLMDIIFNNRNIIYSNMPFDFNIINNLYNLDINPIVDTKFFDNIPNNSNIVWDEITNDLPARGFSTIKNKYISVLGVDIAKKNCRLRGTGQFGDTFDKILSFYCELLIIPEYINKYSDNTKEDNIKRIENEDFTQKWSIIDKRDNEKRYELEINLFPIIFYYNTRFKPVLLWNNHQEFVDRLNKKELEIFNIKNKNEIKLRKDNWYNSQKEIGKVMIR